MLEVLVEAKQEKVINGYDSYFNRRNSIAETTGTQPSGPLFPDEVCVVILDENTTPVAMSNPRIESSEVIDRQDGVVRYRAVSQATENLKRPFVSTEIGEALPHWEVAAYLMNPDAIKKAALTARLTFGLLIALLLIAMVVGSFLIVNDLNRQVTLARQKTDFVSNVSHELKTPLTSIRMFAELLAEDRVAERDKQKSYLNIITSEAARLTRLINNVLDFSRLERGEKKYNVGELDLAALVNETVATYRPHLESNGFHLEFRRPDQAVPVRGDRDALAQVIVNLISNAEKYSNGQKEISVELAGANENASQAEVRVHDRGPGVPRGLEEKIFEQFYRVPDSLSSGIEGSGLGLTLARQIARAHGGDVIYSAREGGGSCFALRLPKA
jgi:signal transduction histidine kinase